MGLKAGWLALFIFVWIIGAFLGSTFEYQSSAGEAGISYSTGTATFIHNSENVTSGGLAIWTSAMEGGNIKADADTTWTKIKHVGGGYLENGTGIAEDATLTLNIAPPNVVNVTKLGTFKIVLPVGNTGTVTGGVCIVAGDPFPLVAGVNTISTSGVVGNITVTIVGSNVIFLYSPYLGTSGAGVPYTMAVSPGWAGSGTGGYTQSPVTTIQYLMNISNAIQRLPLLGNVPLPIPNGQYFKAAYKVITWQWSFMVGYGMFYWIFCAPFVVMGVLSMILLVYGVLTGNLTSG